MENYLQILIDSLDRKLEALKQIQSCNEKQYEIYSSDEPDYESFDALIDEKDTLIQTLNDLDEGFELVYEKVSEELKTNREKYAAYIKRLQSQVREITDLSVAVQAQESRNKKLIEAFFSSRRKKLGEGRRSVQAAMRYYKNQNVGIADPQFMDDKK